MAKVFNWSKLSYDFDELARLGFQSSANATKIYVIPFSLGFDFLFFPVLANCTHNYCARKRNIKPNVPSSNYVEDTEGSLHYFALSFWILLIKLWYFVNVGSDWSLWYGLKSVNIVVKAKSLGFTGKSAANFLFFYYVAEISRTKHFERRDLV